MAEMELKIMEFMKKLVNERDLFSSKYNKMRYILDESYLDTDYINKNLEKFVKYYLDLYQDLPLKLLEVQFNGILQSFATERDLDSNDDKITKTVVNGLLIFATAFIINGSINIDMIFRALIFGIGLLLLIIIYLVIGGQISYKLNRPVLQENKLLLLVQTVVLSFIIDEKNK